MARPKNYIPYNKGTTLSFIEKANTVHKNYYDYSKVTYVNSTTKVTILCSKHGEFSQTPAMHISGQKCPKCAIKQRSRKRALTTELFIQKALKMHNGVYEYSKVKYINNSTKVDIYCSNCNSYFKQTPSDHLNKHGCPNCCKYAIDITKPVTFYVIELESSIPLFKIGITNKTVKERYKSDNPNKCIKSILLEIAFLNGYEAVLFEKHIKENFSQYRYTADTMHFGKTKNTEILTINPVDYVKNKLVQSLQTKGFS